MGALCLNLPFGSPNLTPRHSPAQAKPGAAPGCAPPPPSSFIWWKHAHSSRFTNKPPPQLTARTRYTFSVLLIFQQSTLSWICLRWRFWQKQGASGCTVTEGGPVQLVFCFFFPLSLIEKEQKETHKGAYCICMITGSRTLSEYLQWRNPRESLVRGWKKNHIRIILTDITFVVESQYLFLCKKKKKHYSNQCSTNTCLLTPREKDVLARASLVLPSSVMWILCFCRFVILNMFHYRAALMILVWLTRS